MVSTDVTGNTTETSKSSGGSLGSSVADSSVAMSSASSMAMSSASSMAMSSASSGVEMSSASGFYGE